MIPMLLRVFTSLSLVLAGAVVMSAQEWGTEQQDVVFFNQAVVDPMQKLKEALGLSDVQVTAVQALLNLRRQTIEQISQEGATAHKALADLLAQANPNPAGLGSAFLDTRAIEQRMKAAADKFQSDFAALLNPEQRTTLGNLKAAASQIQALSALGIIEGPMGAMPFMKFLPFEAGAAAGMRGGPGVIQRSIRIQRPPLNQ
jgi:uncharacterized membrane protein